MNRHLKLSLRLSALALAASFAASPALADKPSWAGGGKEGKHGKHEHEEERYDDRRQDDRRGSASIDFRFDDGNRRLVRDYYGAQMGGGKCPPGLAKKNNGCMPPGQAKKWAMGRPLPRDAERYPLPRDLLVRLPMPPAGHEYVRVASDILLIATGTGMVLDAIQDLGR